MPAFVEDDESATDAERPTELPFPPVTRRHILNCSYHSWWPKYRTITPKARLVPLTRPFLDYLRADGIVLPDDDDHRPQWSDDDSGIFSASDTPDAQNESDDEDVDVAADWRNVHNAIKNTIAELGGRVVPKLNWSAPKDATHMNANTMDCRTPNEVYILLKSSNFVTYDLEHVFDDAVSTPDSNLTIENLPYHLILRKAVGQWNPSVEFRCFVRRRRLLCISQREMNHFDFLSNMTGQLRSRIQEFFDVRIRDSFPDENFVFDVYVPPPHNRVWLVDINPWAQRTDPLLFSWMEVLTMPDPPEFEEDTIPEFVRLPMNGVPEGLQHLISGQDPGEKSSDEQPRPNGELADDESSSEDEAETDEEIWLPELRLVGKHDPEAFNFSSPQYSAHKLPKDVVDASQTGDGLREFARDWQSLLSQMQKQDEKADESSDDD